MKQTITIDIDVRDGYELKYNLETRTIEEVKKEPIRSKSWTEFCTNHPIVQEYYINDNGIVRSISECNRICVNNLSTKEDAEGILALIQLTRLHDEWVGDWNPTNGGYPSLIWYDTTDDANHNKIVWTFESKHHLLKFPTVEMACEFLNCFKDLLEKAKKFI